MTEYPNREHETADRRAYRNADIALAALTEHARDLGKRLESHADDIGQRDVDRFGEQVGKLRDALARIETLRDVREWHAADQAERRG